MTTRYSDRVPSQSIPSQLLFVLFWLSPQFVDKCLSWTVSSLTELFCQHRRHVLQSTLRFLGILVLVDAAATQRMGELWEATAKDNSENRPVTRKSPFDAVSELFAPF